MIWHKNLLAIVALLSTSPVFAQKTPGTTLAPPVIASPKPALIQELPTKIAPVPVAPAPIAMPPAQIKMPTELPAIKSPAPLPAIPVETGKLAVPTAPEIKPAVINEKTNLKDSAPQGGGGGGEGGGGNGMTKGGLRDMQSSQPPGQEGPLGEGSKIGRGGGMDDLVNEAPIKGSKYGDTFGGQRINNKHQGDKKNFAGNGKGRTSAGDEGGGVPAPDAGTIATMLTAEGGKPTGDSAKDMAELQYAQSVGPDMYAATKNMSASERKTYLENRRNAQLIGAERPREDDNPSGGKGAPMGRQDIVTTKRGIGGSTGGAGGSNDGRGDQSSPGGNTGGLVVMGKDDKPVRENDTGTININAVLKINQVADPVPVSR